MTGSHIERDTPTTPAPMVILRREELDGFGRTTVADILRQLPAQAGAIDLLPGRGSDGSVRADLRGLGAGRTLTLINGRRVAPGGTGADGSADLSLIPLAIVDRIEIVKAGASAAYGSDATGGVVNIITRSDLHGVTSVTYGGISQNGGGFTYEISSIGGQTWGRKGSLVLSIGHQDQDPVFAQDRPFSRTFAAHLPRLDARAIDTNGDGRPDPVNLCGASVALCTPDTSGGFRPYQAAETYAYAPLGYLDVPSQRSHIHGAGSFELSPGVSGFAEASYLHRTSAQQLEPDVFSAQATGIAISRGNLYNPIRSDVRDYVRQLDEFGPRKLVQDVGAFHVLVGLRGALPQPLPALGGWQWELSYDYGHTSGSEQEAGGIVLSRLAAALGPSFLDAAGGPRCGTSLATAIVGCVPINLLLPPSSGGAGSLTRDAYNYLTFIGSSSGSNTQHAVLATLHGRILELPSHGEVSAAVGAEFRDQAGAFTPDPRIASGDTTAPLQTSTAGSYHVLEGFSELSVVPVTGEPLAERIELDLAARGFQYSSSGGGAVWSAGGLFRPFDGVSLRGTYATTFHAPSVSELFHGPIAAVVLFHDPCDTRPPDTPAPAPLSPTTAMQCAQQRVPADSMFGTSQIRTVAAGNPNLAAETGTNRTVGAVLEPPWIPGLALSVDAWSIDLAHVSQGVPLRTVLASCYERAISSYCARIHRDPAQGYRIDFVDVTALDLGSASASGVDVAVVYRRSLDALGRFDGQLHVQHLLDPGIATTPAQDGGSAPGLGTRPGYAASLFSAWSHPSGLGAAVDLRYIGSVQQCPQGACTADMPPTDAAAWYELDLQGSYSFHAPIGRITATSGVHNLLDRVPPILYVGGLGDPFGSTYDLTGRLFYLRISYQY